MRSSWKVMGCLALALPMATVTAGAQAQSYLNKPTSSDFVRTLGAPPPAAAEAPADMAPATNEEGLRMKGSTRGLRVNMAPASSSRPAASASQARGPSLNFPVQFEFGSAELTPQARAVLDELGIALSSSELKPYRFRLIGHTDAVGSDEFNLELSKRRAQAVEQYLQDRYGIAPERVRSVGVGKSQPYNAQNPFDSINRRVEILRENQSGG
jgi:OmpA-OmpF porin, OOP family